jgi:hypothetical protein
MADVNGAHGGSRTAPLRLSLHLGIFLFVFMWGQVGEVWVCWVAGAPVMPRTARPRPRVGCLQQPPI